MELQVNVFKFIFLKLGAFFTCIFLFSYVNANVVKIKKKLDKGEINEEVLEGSSHLNNKVFKSLRVDGALNFNNLVINENLIVDGAINGNNLKCKKFIINGSFNGENIEAKEGLVRGAFTVDKIFIHDHLTVEGTFTSSKVKVSGKTKIAGQMFVEEGQFTDIEIETNKSSLINTNVKNILVKKEGNKIQKLELTKKTTISGDVIFESNEGEIYLSEDSVIQGKIKGAKIMKIKY